MFKFIIIFSKVIYLTMNIVYLINEVNDCCWLNFGMINFFCTFYWDCLYYVIFLLYFDLMWLRIEKTLLDQKTETYRSFINISMLLMFSVILNIIHLNDYVNNNFL